MSVRHRNPVQLGGGTRIPAAQYVRMSTDHQRYSTENQSDAIRRYAAARGIEIVRTYADEGKSGLRLAGRDALARLIADVTSGRADFTTILVYQPPRDVRDLATRWAAYLYKQGSPVPDSFYEAIGALRRERV